ncbi:hypothetical protein SAMN05216553_12416 [Lentzea fradiae]|uniref:Uncharacterized protein n=1 Tax=Lentzea fradiae TaxID=200378 RepID=A0A1G8CSA8_9PSEU|nr:hypothetical protein SAMN05216553_12416 [Lentzea fradiae]
MDGNPGGRAGTCEVEEDGPGEAAAERISPDPGWVMSDNGVIGAPEEEPAPHPGEEVRVRSCGCTVNGSVRVLSRRGPSRGGCPMPRPAPGRA